MAMEAYDEIKERYNFIITQKEDLLNAKDRYLPLSKKSISRPKKPS